MTRQTMGSIGNPIPELRPLSVEERDLAQWMLEHGGPDARAYLSQLEKATVVLRCPCGCASVDFEVAGMPAPAGGLRVLGDFLYGEDNLCGIFIFERGGVLAGIEVYGIVGQDAPRQLPSSNELRAY